MKSFLQYITEAELDFYIESVSGYCEFMEWVKTSGVSGVLPNGSKDIAAALNLKHTQFINILEDKVVFKYLNSFDWSTDHITENQIVDIKLSAEEWANTKINEE